MKRVKLVFLFLFCICGLSISYAENTYTAGSDYYTIKQITPFSLVQPLNPGWAGNTQLEFTSSITWLGGTGCNTSYVAVREEDKHILSIVMQAFATSKSIRLYTDNTLTVTGSDVCVLRGLSLK